MWGFGFRGWKLVNGIWRIELGVWGLDVWVLGLRVQGSGFRCGFKLCNVSEQVPSGFRVWGVVVLGLGLKL